MLVFENLSQFNYLLQFEVFFVLLTILLGVFSFSMSYKGYQRVGVSFVQFTRKVFEYIFFFWFVSFVLYNDYKLVKFIYNNCTEAEITYYLPVVWRVLLSLLVGGLVYYIHSLANKPCKPIPFFLERKLFLASFLGVFFGSQALAYYFGFYLTNFFAIFLFNLLIVNLYLNYMMFDPLYIILIRFSNDEYHCLAFKKLRLIVEVI
jgi:hypothetical protein